MKEVTIVMFHLRSLRWMFLLCSLCFSSLACRPTNVDPTDNEEEHLHFPKHWPGSLQQAENRILQLSEGKEPTEGLTPFAETRDLIRWLPELVADTDLDESVFNQVESLTIQILSDWPESSPRDLERLQKTEAYQKLLALLRQANQSLEDQAIHVSSS